MSPAWERLFHHIFVLVFTTVTITLLSVGLREITHDYMGKASETSVITILAVAFIGAVFVGAAVARERRLSRRDRQGF